MKPSVAISVDVRGSTDQPKSVEKTITERIVETLKSEGVTAAEWKALRAEAETDLTALKEREAAALATANDLDVSRERSREARNEAGDHAHDAARLELAIARINTVLPSVEAAEHQAEILPKYLAFKALRTKLIADLTIEWPELCSKAADLVSRIAAMEQMQTSIEIPNGEQGFGGVEAEARGCSELFSKPPCEGAIAQPVPRLRDSRLVSFEPSSDGWRSHVALTNAQRGTP